MSTTVLHLWGGQSLDVTAPSYEIVVCDNNSTDDTAQIARDTNATVVFEPHNQIARARNTAAKAARGHWLLFLDADTKLNPVTLRETLAVIESGTVGAGGALIKLDSDEVPLVASLLVAHWNFVSRRMKLAAGSYLYCRRDAWVSTGGFDERYYASEEIWFSRRLKRWCRRERLKFHMVRNPIVTSARKLKWYSPWEMQKQFFVLMIPGMVRRRSRCATWYERPAD